MLSVDEEPVSDAAVKSGTVGVAGAMASTVMVSETDRPDVFPAGSVAATENTWVPLDNVGLV